MSLDQCERYKQVEIIALKGNSAIRRRLMEMGLVPKTRVTILKTAPFKDPLEIYFKNSRFILSKKEAKLIEVRSIRP